MCVFCDIAARAKPAEIVLENDHCLAFLDIRPLFPGHSLVIPRRHVETLDELGADLLGPVFTSVQVLARAVPRAVEAEGSFVAMNNKVSQSVPHLHVHVVPRRRKDGLQGFFWPRHPYDDDLHMRRVAAAVRQCVAAEADG